MNFIIFGLVSSVLLLGRGSCLSIPKIKEIKIGELGDDYPDEEDYPDEDESGHVTPFIVGGNVSEVILPYHVYIECNDKYLCGGALISAQHVLTAAHCLTYAQREKCAVKVVAGTNIRGGGNGLYIMAATGFMHSEYSEDTKEHDIGVYKLVYPFTLSKTIWPVTLAPNPPVDNDLIMVSGYGRINRKNYEMSDSLKTYKSGLRRYEGCYNRANGKVFPTDVCDYGVTDLGACQGDSGSPVVNRFYLVAIVSRGISPSAGENGVVDCTNGTPNIFTSVFYHLDFIKSCLKK